MKKYYGQKPDGKPWISVSEDTRDMKYVCVIDVETQTGSYIYANGKVVPLSAWQIERAETYWREISQAQAYASIGLKLNQEPQFYLRGDSCLFEDKNGHYVMFFKGNDAYAYHASGMIQFLPHINSWHRNQWKHISYEKARSMLGRKPNFDATALAEVMGLTVKSAPGKATADDKSPLIFRHFRYNDGWGDIYGGGGVTVGVIINHTKKVLEVYPVVCHKEDTFEKSRGRDLATQRYSNKFGVQIPYDESESIGYNIFVACDKHVDGMEKMANVSGNKGGRDWELLVDTFARTMCDDDLMV